MTSEPNQETKNLKGPTMSNPMNAFLGLLAAVVGLMAAITLSIMELWVIPWPILLILLLVILWTSQRLIDRFNPAPVEGLSSLPTPLKESLPLGIPHRDQDFASDYPESPLRYRGQIYEETATADPLLEESLQAKPTCYRGIRLETPDSLPSPETSTKPKPSERPQLNYRGIKRS
jgi:hypothetical protein